MFAGDEFYGDDVTSPTEQPQPPRRFAIGDRVMVGGALFAGTVTAITLDQVYTVRLDETLAELLGELPTDACWSADGAVFWPAVAGELVAMPDGAEFGRCLGCGEFHCTCDDDDDDQLIGGADGLFAEWGNDRYWSE